MNKPTTGRELELRSDWDEVRAGGLGTNGTRKWETKRRRVKKAGNKARRRLGQHLVENDYYPSH